MVLLMGMSVLSEEQMDGMVEWQDESEALKSVEEIIQVVGGKVHGHHVLVDGSSIDHGQFEVIKNVNEI